MSVSFSGQVDYSTWKRMLNSNSTTSPQSTSSTTNYQGNYQNYDYFVSESGETCTDGKDDGKIGFFSAAWNTIKGVGKTAVNMVKGCFTNSEGKFSLGKTLLTAATAAVCVAFPAVGLVACGIGVATGAVKIGQGVYKAATATTDAEAKLAWQEVGGGALQTGLSIAGAKASYGAVMKTSTAGASGGSAMSELGKEATLLQKGVALAKDMRSSTANRAGAIKTAVSTKIGQNSNIKAGQELLKEAKASGNKDEIALAEELLKDAKADAAKTTVKTAVKAGYKQVEKLGKSAIDKVSHPIKTATTLFKQARKAISKESISKLPSNLRGLANKIIKGETSLDALVKEYGSYEKAIEVLEVLTATESV